MKQLYRNPLALIGHAVHTFARKHSWSTQTRSTPFSRVWKKRTVSPSILIDTLVSQASAYWSYLSTLKALRQNYSFGQWTTHSPWSSMKTFTMLIYV